jgi:hypothetical protein
MARRLRLDQQKKRILATLAQSDNLSEACINAQINREQFRVMCADNVISVQELADCKAQYTDRVLQAANKAALDAPLQPLIKYGKPVLDADNKPVMHQQSDLNALRFLMDRLIRTQEDIKETLHGDSIPELWRLVFDGRELDTKTIRQYQGTEIEVMTQIQTRVERARKQHDYYVSHKSNGHKASTQAGLDNS